MCYSQIKGTWLPLGYQCFCWRQDADDNAVPPELLQTSSCFFCLLSNSMLPGGLLVLNTFKKNKSQSWYQWGGPNLVKMTSTEALTELEAATQNSLPYYSTEVVPLFPNERGVGIRTDFAGFQLVENFYVVSFGKLLWRKSWWAITTVVQNRIRQRREIKGWGCSHRQRKATLFPTSSLPLLKHCGFVSRTSVLSLYEK